MWEVRGCGFSTQGIGLKVRALRCVCVCVCLLLISFLEQLFVELGGFFGFTSANVTCLCSELNQ